MKARKVLFLLFLFSFLLINMMMLGACHSNAISSYFPVSKISDLPPMEVAFRGWLMRYDNCLRLKAFYCFGKGYLLIWPYGFSQEMEENEIRVLDNNDKVVARVGDYIRFAGGEIPIESVEKVIGGHLPDNCTGPYILVGYFDLD